jgi:hypothetical protein
VPPVDATAMMMVTTQMIAPATGMPIPDRRPIADTKNPIPPNRIPKALSGMLNIPTKGIQHVKHAKMPMTRAAIPRPLVAFGPFTFTVRWVGCEEIGCGTAGAGCIGGAGRGTTATFPQDGQLSDCPARDSGTAIISRHLGHLNSIISNPFHTSRRRLHRYGSPSTC